jgi:group I intron endonuclease
MLPKTSGIYRIDCATNGKVYVGSAHSMYQRQHVHLHHLRRGVHVNRHLQHAWNKYGETTFQFSVIEKTSTAELLLREQFWIDRMDACNPKCGFNIQPQARSSRGVKRTEVYLKNMAEQKSKQWIVTQPDGTELTIKNLAEFCRQHDLSFTSMHRVARGKLRQYRNGWLCRKADATSEEWQRTCKPAAATNGQFQPGKWVLTAPNGKQFEVDNLRSFCNTHGLLATGLSNVVRGLAKQHKGWKCHRTESEVA